MTITNGYCTLTELKHSNRLNINDSDSTSDDMLEGVIEAVSRKFDEEAHRFFYKTSSQARWYTAMNDKYVFVDDIPSDSDITIAIDTNDDGTVDNTLTTSDYVLEPFNAPLDGWPYQKITIRGSSQFLFPKNVIKAVKVTSPFGWSAVPKPITEACKVQSERVFMFAQTPLGSTSMTALGKMTITIPNLDKDVLEMIDVYIRKRSGFG